MMVTAEKTYTKLQRWCSYCSKTTTRPVASIEEKHGDPYWKNCIKIVSTCPCGAEVVDFHPQKDVDNMISANILI